MISKKTILAGIFSAIVGVGMLAIPVKAIAHDWNHDGDGGRHEHHDNGNHNGWYNHGDRNNWGGGNNGWYNRRGEDEEEEHERRGDYRQPYNYGYYQHENEDEGYGYPANGQGMISRAHPGLMWTCDSQGHHCHWARRPGYSYYGNGFNGNNGYYTSPLGGLGSLFGMPMP